MNTWNLLRHDGVEEGLLQLREAYTRKPSGSHIMELGVAYLWAQDYHAAASHFQHALQTHRHTTSGFYGMAGASRWCLDEPQAAVEQWRLGLGAQYADMAGGGIHLPLLLFVASILRPAVFSTDEAKQILKEKVKDSRVKIWPGPLGQFVLGLTDEKALEELCVGNLGLNERGPLPHRKRLIGFYRDILEFSRLNKGLATFQDSMKRMADTSQPEWSDERHFLHLLWCEEFFIARHEASLQTVHQAVLS